MEKYYKDFVSITNQTSTHRLNIYFHYPGPRPSNFNTNMSLASVNAFQFSKFVLTLKALVEFGPEWLEIRHTVALRHNFSIISFDYSLAKKLVPQSDFTKLLKKLLVTTHSA